jgi:hypothetical protein
MEKYSKKIHEKSSVATRGRAATAVAAGDGGGDARDGLGDAEVAAGPRQARGEGEAD